MHCFFKRLDELTKERDSLLCVGLDSDMERIPRSCLLKDNPQLWFNQQIVDATKDLVCAYKINLAFYESLGATGLETLTKTLAFIPSEIPVIADAKRGDIGNTARHYAKAVFDVFGFDAVTVNPYMGYDSLRPFLEYQEKGVFVLCLTSNPGAKDFQLPNELYLSVAERCREWNERFGNIGLVVGALYPEQASAVRQRFPEGWFLIPGIGAQGGDISAVLQAGRRKTDKSGLIFNVSRSIIFASQESDFAQRAREQAEHFLALIREAQTSIVE